MRARTSTMGLSFLCSLALCMAACGGDSSSSDGDGTGDGDDGDGDGDDDGGGDSMPATCATDLTPELERLGVPGLAAAIVKNGRIACTAVAGLANIEMDVPVTPRTIFWWASVSKPVSATGALSVWEDGAFALDDEVNGYLPYAVVHPRPACADTAITFQQLLTHTSSIFEDEEDPPYKNGFVVGKPRQPLGEFLHEYLVPGGATYSPGNFINACPGRQDNYSSIGYGLLGFTVESIVEQPFDQICKERIFDPLGMADTSFTLADLDEAKLAMPYGGNAAFTPLGHREHANYPDGSLRSSVLDLSRFLLMSMQLGEYQGTRILDEATVRAMFEAQIPDLDEDQGYAWYHDTYGGRAVIGHDGWDPGASSLMFFDPSDGAGVLLVANGEWRNDAFAEDILVTLFAESLDH